jgi:hypothetical protein
MPCYTFVILYSAFGHKYTKFQEKKFEIAILPSVIQVLVDAAFPSAHGILI